MTTTTENTKPVNTDEEVATRQCADCGEPCVNDPSGTGWYSKTGTLCLPCQTAILLGK